MSDISDDSDNFIDLIHMSTQGAKTYTELLGQRIIDY
jgi:hypothetical protein